MVYFDEDERIMEISIREFKKLSEKMQEYLSEGIVDGRMHLYCENKEDYKLWEETKYYVVGNWWIVKIVK